MIKTGGRGASSGAASLKSKLAGNKIELDYARQKLSEYQKTLNYSEKYRDRAEAWRKEVRRLEKERETLKNEQSGKNNKFATATQKAASAETAKKLPTRGKKVQESYIDYVKKQTNIDLSKARDTQFDNQKGFNIDVTKLGKNDLSAIKSLQRQYSGGYDVHIIENGANRKFIQVTRQKKG